MQTQQAGALADYLYRMQLQGGIVYVYGDPNGFYFGAHGVRLPFLNPQLIFHNSDDVVDTDTAYRQCRYMLWAIPSRQS
jgi:hypothetical protein